MGCGSSRSSAVKKIDPNKPPPVPRSAGSRSERSSSGRSQRTKPQSADHSLFGRKKKGRPESGATASVSNVALRNANSAASTKSGDSGFGSEIRGSPENFQGIPEKVPLGSTVTKESVKPERVDPDKILSGLRNEGLLGEGTTTNQGGVCYEIPLGELQPPKRKPPARLQKLERQAEMDNTRQRIKEKLEKAERRRKRREQEKVERSKEKDARNLEVKLALLEIEKNKEKEMRKQVNLNVHTHLERRSSKLDEIKEKNKLEASKVEEAQRRKLLSPRPLAPDPKEVAMMSPRPTPKNIDELPVPAARKR